LTGRKKNPTDVRRYSEVVNIFRAAARDKISRSSWSPARVETFRPEADVFEIIGPLIEMDTVSLLDFTG